LLCNLSPSIQLGFREEFLTELDANNIKILGDIPLDDDIVKSYCQGIPIMDEDSKFDRRGEGFKSFENIYKNLITWLNHTAEE
jgi:MinD superfamily P-loop ATPase